MILRAKEHTFRFPGPVLVMGIVNVTPDSFSDGGRYFSADAAVAHALQLVAEGADVLDVGGESTRPNAAPVEEAEELRRVLHVIRELAAQVRTPISIDTMKPAVAAAALDAGACIVNDVAANRTDPAMWRLVGATGAGYIAMHMQGSPQTMQENPDYEDVVEEVNEFFGQRLQALAEAGVSADHVVLDPGLGFGKSLDHNLQLIASLDRFTTWKRPVLLGASRKSFLKWFAEPCDKPEGRLPGSLACACWAARQGAAIVRTHDVAATRQALGVTMALLATTNAD
jgi:dihydropteroate synthase